MIRILIFLFICTGVFAQPQMAPEFTQASELAGQQKWQEAVNVLEDLIQKEPKNGAAYMYLARIQYLSGKFDACIETRKACIQLGYAQFLNHYGIAKCNAKLGKPEVAAEHLEQALNTGFDDVEKFQSEEDFSSYRDHQAFVAFAKNLKEKATPCLVDPMAQALDFWIGEWRVFDQNGVEIGRNTIQQEVFGCAIYEHWRSIHNKFEGKSWNYFDPIEKNWVQVWTGKNNRPAQLVGPVSANGVELFGVRFQPDGTTVKTKMILRPKDDKVEQVFEQSKDGKVWEQTGINTYVRVETAQNAK